MISLKIRRRIILGCTTLLILMMLVGVVYVISQAPGKNGKFESPSATTTPGLVVYGDVRSISGEGVANVNIYRSLAGYPGVLVATTDPHGSYQSDFKYIPGDEMVTVKAEGLGLTYTPEQYFWRHYYGYQNKRCDFIASSGTETMLPIIIK